MKLLIVESPTKATKIAKFLPSEWRVEASRGHLRDLPEKALGVDLKDEFALRYELLADHRGTLTRLKKLAADADAVYLATDPDREGEAIAWHLAELLRHETQKIPIQRVTFNAVTQKAVTDALVTPRRIDLALVDAQVARRTLDRLVGYLVSPIACKKLDGRYSAGRVQSACLRLVVEREAEITGFTPTPYWTLEAHLEAGGQPFTARLSVIRETRAARWSQSAVEKVVEALRELTFIVAQVKSAEVSRHPLPPFTTSTLQQAASKALGLTPDRTMQLAQTLYEHGLITYMRTDAVFVAPEAQESARSLIESDYGVDYVPALPQVYVTKSAMAQEAHEAIRPTDVSVKTETLPEGGGRDLYALIWKRFVASQMRDARYAVSAALIIATQAPGKPFPVEFTAKGRTLVFDGFLKVYEEALDDGETRDDGQQLPALTNGQALALVTLTPSEHQAEPPPRFTDASLVAALEQRGIGRPSTYAGMVRLLRDRGYVKADGKRLMPTESGIKLNEFLTASFPDVFAPEFTAKFESQLDQIVTGKSERLTVLNAFWLAFYPLYKPLADQYAPQAKPTAKPPLKVLGKCPKCGGDLVERHSKHGVFAGCVNFPKCKGRPVPATFAPASRKGGR